MPVHDNDRHAVVLDIGHAYTKCGFVGENEPRVIIPSFVQSGSKKSSIFEYEDVSQLYNNLIKFLHKIFFKYLLVNHRERRVVLVESILSPTEFRDTLARALFLHFEVPSILFAPSHLVSLYTLGINTALVIDLGYDETTMIPICEGTPLVHAWQAQPLGAKAIHKRLESLLMLRSKVKGVDAQEVPLNEVSAKLDSSFLEDITVRTCFVTTLARSRQLIEAQTNEDGPAPPSPPPAINYWMSGDLNLVLDGSIREQAAEILFETDNDLISLASMVLDVILQCPIDCRVPLVENLVFVGGTAMLPGLKARLIAEVRNLQQHPKYSSKIHIKHFKVHRPPAKANYVAWLGGAILGATEAIATRSYQRDIYLINRRVPDWMNLADNVKESDKTS